MNADTTRREPLQAEQTAAAPQTLQDDLDVLYPPSIVQWELDHHIVREVRGGMMYVRCTDWEAFNRQLEEDRLARRRQALQAKIARQQAAAYLGEQEKMAL